MAADYIEPTPPCRGRKNHYWSERGIGTHATTMEHVGVDERICLQCNIIQQAVDSKRTRIHGHSGLPVPVNTRWSYKRTRGR